MLLWKRLWAVPLIVAALALGGCATWDKVKEVVAVATTTIVNPVDSTDIYRIKHVYAATLKIADKYRAYCEPKLYAEILADPVARPICKDRRRVIRAIVDKGMKARDAIASVEKFVRENPTFSAADLIKAAWAAVQDFQRATPQS